MHYQTVLVHRVDCINPALTGDDIFTTGSTVDEIASLLKGAGARRVDFLAYAGGADMIVS